MEPVEVLIVEDREEDAHIAIRELKKNNIANNVRWVEDGEEAIEYLESNPIPPRVVFLDLKMPKISGLEVLKKMRSFEHTKNTPVVVMTSSQEDKDIEESYEYGVNSYVVKPVDFQSFSNVIRQLGFYWLVVNYEPKGNIKKNCSDTKVVTD